MPSLYGSAQRLSKRTDALHTAKIAGSNATLKLTEAVARIAPERPVLADIGCGRGSLALSLAARLDPSRMIAVDTSRALLATVATRSDETKVMVEPILGDFHALPLEDGLLDVATAAFCIYHSEYPIAAIAEIARCVTSGGYIVLATKSTDSYHELDDLLARTGLDSEATTRASLYTSFHSANSAATVEAAGLDVLETVNEQHVFRFDGPAHLASYLATIPKYSLAGHLANNPQNLAIELSRRGVHGSVTATSTVTYLTGSVR
jgi:ubiquinone/menaquinone biosynthesis C-methylase UbiE